MAAIDGRQQFEREVFPAEIEEIRRRRTNVGDKRPLGTPDGEPSTKLDLMGLAFSGGGIRSASFSIGVVQHLIAKGVFEKVDYLSTVSGGGYAGACLSALMHGQRHGERLLIERRGANEPPALNHVRNCSNYLLTDGLLNRLQFPALFIAGLFHSLLMMLPPIVLAVLLTEIFFELTSYFLIDTRHWLAIIGVVPLVLALILRPLRAGRGTWAERDRADRRLGGWLALAVVSLLAVPLLKWLGDAINHDASWVYRNIAKFFQEQGDLGVRSWLLWVSAATGVALIVGTVRLRMRLVLLLVGVLGPLFLLSIYVIACIYAVNSPVSKDENGALRQAIDAYRAVAAAPTGVLSPATLAAQEDAVEALVRNLLITKHIDPDRYEIQWNVLRDDDALILKRRREAPLWKRLLTQQGSSELHIGFVSGWWSALGEADDAHPHIVIEELKLLKGHAEWWLYLGGLLLWLYNTFFMNLNSISMHPFYRDRLSRTFLITPKGDPPAPLVPADDLQLSRLGGERSAAPYHLINTALNLQGSHNPQLRERKTVAYILAQRFCGSDLTGYCQTAHLEAIDPRFNLGTAMAISAAAASPNMGTVTVRPLTFLLAVLNMRLNYWLPHPDMAGHRSWYLRLLYGRPGLLYLLAEALGTVNERTPFINCSDGGHIENLAVYELLRRRCRTIICVDGEADPHVTFFGFVTMQRYAEIDLGARIDIQLDAIRPHDGISQRHHAVGKITYAGGEEGTFIYLKLSYTGDEPEYLRFYKHISPVFPHETTADQFFDETQFEVYRALGHHVAKGVTDDPASALDDAPVPVALPVTERVAAG